MISSQRKAALLLGLAFLLGVLTGAAATAMASHRDGGPPRGARRGAWYLEHLSRELDLAGAQRDSVKAVLDRYGPRMDTIMDGVRPQLDAVRAEMRAEIARHLTDDQKEEFERMRQQHQRNREGGANARR